MHLWRCASKTTVIIIHNKINSDLLITSADTLICIFPLKNSVKKFLLRIIYFVAVSFRLFCLEQLLSF